MEQLDVWMAIGLLFITFGYVVLIAVMVLV